MSHSKIFTQEFDEIKRENTPMQDKVPKKLMGGEAGLSSSIRQAVSAYDRSTDFIRNAAGGVITGYTLVAWDHKGNSIVETHFSMHSGVEPANAPEVVSQMVEQAIAHAMEEAKVGARA
jgi:hypothetical protein